MLTSLYDSSLLRLEIENLSLYLRYWFFNYSYELVTEFSMAVEV